MTSKLGRNDPCWCGSGKKYKKCHLQRDEKKRSSGWGFLNPSIPGSTDPLRNVETGRQIGPRDIGPRY